MKFVVSIRSMSEDRYKELQERNVGFAVLQAYTYGEAVDLKPAEGLHLIDLARAELGTEDLDADFVEYFPGHREEVKLELTEDQARRAGHFYSTCTVHVIVPTGFLNPYADLKPVLKITESEDGDQEVRISWRVEVDSEAILRRWLAEGAPRIWGFPDDYKEVE